jgi:alkanesulfonate monooxygenase SsuD/methylene tetrahydromethanopterin reductase-like flavin-dependent oxidoreductase (luciferase family)
MIVTLRREVPLDSLDFWGWRLQRYGTAPGSVQTRFGQRLLAFSDPHGLKVVSPVLVIAETDREAMDQARKYIPRWFRLQVEHYAADEKLYGNVPSYSSFSASFKQRVANCNPDNLGRLFEVSLIGSAETVRARLQKFLDVGYNYVMVQPSLPGLPHEIRQDWLTRFARDVMPHFGARPRLAPAAARRGPGARHHTPG